MRQVDLELKTSPDSMADQEWRDRHFLNIQLSEATMDAYVPRRLLLKAVQHCMTNLSGTLLDVGCGQMPYKGMMMTANPKIDKYLGLDLESSSVHDTSVADLHWDGSIIPLANDSVDSAMATEVLEHSFEPEKTLQEIARVLKPNGLFFYTVPFLWPLHEVPYDAYRYTPFSLRRHLERTGFEVVEMKSLGGWHASFAQMLGLWVIEGKLQGWKRKVALRVAKKMIPYLLKIDKPDNSFSQHCMITGLYGIARKKQ